MYRLMQCTSLYMFQYVSYLFFFSVKEKKLSVRFNRNSIVNFIAIRMISASVVEKLVLRSLPQAFASDLFKRPNKHAQIGT